MINQDMKEYLPLKHSYSTHCCESLDAICFTVL